jgi:hypothetical protein
VNSGKSQSLSVTAVVVEPSQFPDQIFGQLDAFRVDLKTPLIDSAFTTDHIEIAAGNGRMKDGPVFFFDLFEAAAPALPADGFPSVTVVHGEEHTACGGGCQ